MNHEYWYISRAAGFTAYLLLFIAVVLGIANGTRFADRFIRRNSIFDMHRFTTILALSFATLHVFILLGDGYFHINLKQLLVPFLSPYRPWQVAVGIFAFYTLGLVVASFYIRKYIGYRVWRALHFVTFALFAAVTLHGIMSGTDTNQLWAKAVYLFCGATVMLLTFYRVQHQMPEESHARTMRLAAAIGTGVAALVLLLGTGLFTAGSPPASAVADVGAPGFADGSTSGAVPASSQDNQPFPFLDSFDDDFNGTYVQSQDATSSHLTLDGTTSGDLSAKVHIELGSTAAPGSRRASITLNKAAILDPATNATICSGEVTEFDDGYMRIQCIGAGPYAGVNMLLSSRVSGNRDGTFSGALSGSMQHG